MAFPVVKFNNSTGSDTAASGAGPATAVTGTAAAHTGGVASTTITLTNSPDLTNVATDGSHVLWMKTASGRQFSKIVGKGAGTVTVEDSFTIALASAVNYAIGGKRSNFYHADSLLLWMADIKAGWTIDLEYTGSNYVHTAGTIPTLTSAGSDTDGPITIMSSSSQRPTLQASTGTSVLRTVLASGGMLVVKNLRFIRDTSSNWPLIDLAFASGRVLIEDCDLDGFDYVAGSGSRTTACIYTSSNPNLHNLTVRRCHLHGARAGNGYGIHINDIGIAAYGTHVYDCLIENCLGHGIFVARSTKPFIHDNVIVGNGGDGIYFAAGTTVVHGMQIVNNVIHDNDGDGIEIARMAYLQNATILNNSITQNGGYGVNVSDINSSAPFQGFTHVDHNNFGTGGSANVLGNYNNLTGGANDLNVDPQYTNAGAFDFSVGTNLKAKGYPKFDTNIGLGSTTKSFVDIGAAQRQEAGGAGRVLGSSVFGG